MCVVAYNDGQAGCLYPWLRGMMLREYRSAGSSVRSWFPSLDSIYKWSYWVMYSLFLLLRTMQSFPQGLYSFAFSPTVSEISLFSRTLPTLILHLNNSHSNRCVMMSSMFQLTEKSISMTTPEAHYLVSFVASIHMEGSSIILTLYPFSFKMNKPKTVWRSVSF